MSFSGDVKATPHLERAFRTGLAALVAVDKARLTVAASNRLLGSANVDAALHATQPNAARWDYVVGQKRDKLEHLNWIEVHPASGTGNISEMEAKLKWLATWMKATPLGEYPREIVWIASGRSAFNSRDPALRRLANCGLRFAGGHLSI
jgi:hypothetical protein